ncbi:hypothetical protein O3M35_002636 [Rhynocoris fuscipes]|uniref:Uncharacterized protein n=1 Tax=Rhynocoris fuscipes TaxID=488301 RepID=A0AAW1CS05_9HEMI
MKIFDFQISMEIPVLSLPESILTILTIDMTSVCVCADVRMIVSCITQNRLIVEY